MVLLDHQVENLIGHEGKGGSHVALGWHGLGLIMGCVGSEYGILDKQVVADVDGSGCLVGLKQSDDKKGRKKVDGYAWKKAHIVFGG